MNRGWPGVALAFLLAGCVHYAPKPPQPGAFEASLDARRLEAPVGAGAADLLAEALRYNPGVAEARARYQMAVAAARVARLSPGLTLTLTGEYADEGPRWGGGAAADVAVDGGARRRARVSSGDLQTLQAGYDVGETIWAARLALVKSGVDRVSAEAEIALAVRAVDLRKLRLERLNQRVAAGADDRTVAINARADLSAAERRLIEARGRAAQAAVDQAGALGASAGAVQNLVVTPAATLPALEGIAGWRRDAIASRGDVLRAIADYDLAENALRLEISRQYPEVRFGPGYTYDHGVNKLPFSLTLVLPGYDLNRHAIAQAEAARAAAGRSLESTQAGVLSAIDTALTGLNTAHATFARIEQQDRPEAHKMALLTARLTLEGAADRVDDLAAQLAELEAELNLVDARRSVGIAVADLEYALRRPFDPEEAAAIRTAMTRPGEMP